jgi:predicted metalloprotease with PDZ domain
MTSDSKINLYVHVVLMFALNELLKNELLFKPILHTCEILYRTFHNNHFTVYLFMFHHGQNGRGFAHYKAVILWEWKKHEIRYLIQISNKLK